MARVNILKGIKVDGRWKMVSTPRRKQSNSYDWKSLHQVEVAGILIPARNE